MSTRKFVALLVAALILFVVALIPMALACAESEFYPKAAVVISVSIGEEVIVTVEDGEGNLWDIYWDLDEEFDIELGDVLAMLIWNCGTPDYIFDDEVIDVVNEHFKAE